jgi:4-amino-4-deoxy-L-arabinose transferase-like glycosyltransferase
LRLRALHTLALIYAGALGLAVALQIQGSPWGIRPIVDERLYVEWAQRIAHGAWVGDDVFFFDPLYAYVLGVVFKLTQGSLLAARLLQVVLAVGTVALISRTATALFGEKTAVVAAWLLALYGPAQMASGFLLKESLAIHLTAWALWLVVRTQDAAAKWMAPFGLGLSFGALCLLRGNFLPLVLVLLAWAFVSMRPIRRPGLILAGLAVPLGLSLAHNLAAGGQLVVTTSHGGPNFWMGNNPASTGTYEAPAWVEARPSSEIVAFQAEAERRLGRPLTRKEVQQYWLDEGLRFWSDTPGAALELTAKKAWLLLNDYEVPDNYAFTCVRGFFAPALWFAPLGWGALLGLALLGAWRAWSSQPRARPIVAFAVLYGASVAAFFIFDRYRLPLVPPLCLLAAYGVFELNARRAAAVVLISATAFVPTHVSAHRAWHDAQCVGSAGRQLLVDHHVDEARPLLEESARLAPEYAYTQQGLELLRDAGP